MVITAFMESRPWKTLEKSCKFMVELHVPNRIFRMLEQRDRTVFLRFGLAEQWLTMPGQPGVFAATRHAVIYARPNDESMDHVISCFY